MKHYDILRHEHGEASAEDGCVSTDPHWILVVVRYAYPLTVSRKKIAAGLEAPIEGSVSFNTEDKTISQTRKTLVITSDCVSLNTNSSKGNHVSTLRAVLVGETNYLAEILPGDWVLAWIMNNRQDFDDVLSRIKSEEKGRLPPNQFEDGLKFVGRVRDIRKTLLQGAEGLRTVKYQLQCAGFSELDADIFYNPHLSRNVASIGEHMARLGISLEKIYERSAEIASEGGITSNTAIPVFLKAFVGDGIPSEGFSAGNLKTADGPISTEEAKYAYGVPEAVGNLLGVTAKTKGTGMFSYADILNLILGVQKYSAGNGGELGGQEIFFPEGTRKYKGSQSYLLKPDTSAPEEEPNRFFTSYPLVGSFQPLPQAFDSKTVWTMLQEYLNPALNEMYTTLKYTPGGSVMPTLVVRQYPFSTPVMTAALGNKVTSFSELPRWKAHPSLIRALDIGRSDSARFNYISVYGQAPGNVSGADTTSQMVRAPPLRDEQDVKRNGLRMYAQTVACSVTDTQLGASRWMTIVSDFMIGQQLTLNGTASLVGVQSPICPGDNLEIDDTVYHIESVSHTCGVSNGLKSFSTGVTLTLGIRADLDPSNPSIPKNAAPYIKTKVRGHVGEGPEQLIEEKVELTEEGQNPDLYMYSGIHLADTQTHDPAMAEEDGLKERK
jgi:hypothetical protein